MTLRDYQIEFIPKLRDELRVHKSVFMQLHTGGGKTVIVSAITASAMEKNNRVWFVVPRNVLLDQASRHFTKWNIPHGRIDAKTNESNAYKIFVVSKDTVMRRISKNKIKHWPDLVIFDEAHVAIDQQKTIIEIMPDTTKAIGISATPERTDGRGLSDIYESIVYGPTLAWLIEHKYLSDMRYYSPPIEGINDLKRRGTEFDEEELDALLSRRAVYGQSIDHYRRLANKKPCIVFCRSIKSSKETAQRFCNAGYLFEDIDGTMSDKKRNQILNGLATGRIHGITTVDLVCYGLDIEVVGCIIMLRPTLSKPLFFQMIGRGLRKSEGKEYCVILDHVGNLSRFGYPKQDTEWNFYGKEKKNYIKTESEAVLKMCPNCFLYFEGTKCPYCGHEGHREKKFDEQVIDGRLVEVGALPMKERPPEEQRTYEQRIALAVEQFRLNGGAVEEMLRIAEELNRSPMWVYYELTTRRRESGGGESAGGGGGGTAGAGESRDDNKGTPKAVNVPLLYEIARIKGYAKGWVYFKLKELRAKGKPAI